MNIESTQVMLWVVNSLGNSCEGSPDRDSGLSMLFSKRPLAQAGRAAGPAVAAARRGGDGATSIFADELVPPSPPSPHSSHPPEPKRSRRSHSHHGDSDGR
jgi:hypothetical protein